MKTKKILSGYGLIINYIGMFMILIGIWVLLPLLILVFYPSEAHEAVYFILPGTLSVFVGYAITLIFRGREIGKLERHQDAILVTLIWIVAIVIGAVPFMLTGIYNFTQAVFEVTSGVSTTGLTVVDVEATSHLFLFYRALLLFFGGVGFILIMTSAVSDRYGMRLFNAEGHSDRVMPNLIKSARMILAIYSGIILLGVLGYVLCGMSVFDAVTHSIAAVSTGGFGTHAANIGYFNSLGVELITLALMFMGATNFMVHVVILKTGFKKAIFHSEFKLIAVLCLIFIPILAVSLWTSGYASGLGSAFRIALFQFGSSLTTTGFQTVATFQNWPHLALFILIIAMIIGGGIGSTAGGMKQYRVALALKSMYWNFRDQIFPKRMVKANFINRYGKKELVSTDDIKYNYGFLFTYMGVLLAGTLIYTAFGYSFEASLFEFSSALSTVGLSIGITGYAAHPVILWTATFGMLLGRLEFYVVFLALVRLGTDITKKGVLA